MKMTDGKVAAETEEATHPARGVVMINY